MVNNRRWTAQEDEYLLAHYSDTATDEIADALKRTPYAIQQRVKMLSKEGRHVHKGRYNLWTADEDRYLIDHANRLSVQEIATHLKRTTVSVKLHVTRLRRQGKIAPKAK